MQDERVLIPALQLDYVYFAISKPFAQRLMRFGNAIPELLKACKPLTGLLTRWIAWRIQNGSKGQVGASGAIWQVKHC